MGRYLRNEIIRVEAIDVVRIDWVELVERQHGAMMEDLALAIRKYTLYLMPTCSPYRNSLPSPSVQL